MAEVLSGYANARLSGGRYLFLLVELNDFATARSEEIQRQLAPFGERLGPEGGWVVSVFTRASQEARADLRAKTWPDDFRNDLFDSADPALLVINKDFAEFDPREHPWAVVWFRDYDPATIPYLLNAIANKASHGEDLFAYLSRASHKGRFSRFSRYFEVKPSIFGISLNANAILDDLTRPVT